MQQAWKIAREILANPKVIVVLVGLNVVVVGYYFFGPVYGCRGCSDFAHDMVYSFREQPERWHEDMLHVVRDDGTDFWIGNGASYFEPWCCLSFMPREWQGGAGFASREQRYVYTAYKAWRRDREREFAKTF